LFLFKQDSFFSLLAVEAEFLPVGLKLIPFILSLAGASLASFLYQTSFIKFFLFKDIIGLSTYRFFNYKWYVDVIYNCFARFLMFIGYSITLRSLDRGLIEFVGPTGLVQGISFLVNKIKALQIGFLHSYLLFFVSILGYLAVISLVGVSSLIVLIIFVVLFLSCFFL